MNEFDTLLMLYDTREQKINTCCNNPNIIIDINYNVCTNCGAISNYHMQPDINYDSFQYKKQLYVRKSYFREKFKLLTCVKHSNSPKYKNLINLLKNDSYIKKVKTEIKELDDEEIRNHLIKNNFLYDLRLKIKEMKYTKMYKYIYNIIYDLYGFKCVYIPVRYLDKMTNEWLKFETCYKQIYPNKRNMICYNVIIRLFLKKYNINYYEFIILPKNKMKVFNHLSHLNYFNSIEI